jgi:hypothetical protein
MSFTPTERWSDRSYTPQQGATRAFDAPGYATMTGAEGPLQFAGYNEVGQGYTGLAENQQASDFDRQTKESTVIEKQQADLLRQILDEMKKSNNPAPQPSVLGGN